MQGRVEYKDFPVEINRDLDLLFVIDDSPSMADKQANLAANFPRFINVLSTLEGGLPNIHIAVVTSDHGTKDSNGRIAPGVGSPGQGGCSGSGDFGNMQLFSAAPLFTDTSPFISDIQPPDPLAARVRNYAGKLEDVFAQMARGAGAGGCGFEQHLEAMKQALVPTNVVNQDFLRPNAFLGVIFIADEDDCSMSDSTALLGPTSPTLGALQSFRCTRFGVVCDDAGATPDAMNALGPKGKCHPSDTSPYLAQISGYVDFLKGLKPDPSRVIVAGIMGTTEPVATENRLFGSTQLPSLAHSCTYVGGDGKTEVADPPIRLKFFLDQFPNRSTFAPICQQDLSGGLRQIGDLLKTVLGNPCIEGKLADVDQQTAGKQHDCSVSSVTDPGLATQKETIMPKCTPEDDTATNQPCWHLVSDPMACPCSAPLQDGVCPTNVEGYTIKIEGKDSLTTDTHIIANCVTEVNNN